MAKWLEGRKTYILAAVFLVLLGGLTLGGQLTPSLAVDLLVFAAPCFAATFRDAIQKNHSQVLAVLTEIAEAGVDLRTHNTAALEADGKLLVTAAVTDVQVLSAAEPATASQAPAQSKGA